MDWLQKIVGVLLENYPPEGAEFFWRY